MQAIILAAGMGKRLKDYTKNNTKCMVEVCGETLIERMLKQLDQKKSVESDRGYWLQRSRTKILY